MMEAAMINSANSGFCEKCGTPTEKGARQCTVCGPANHQPLEVTGVLRKFSFAPFALVIICFLMPFVEVSCQGNTVASFTGLNLAFGLEVAEPTMFGPPGTRHVSGETTALLALGLAVAALCLSLISKRLGSLPPAVVSALGLLFMLILKVKLDSEVSKQAGGMLRLEYTFFFTSVCVLFLVGAALHGYFFQTRVKEKPPSIDSSAHHPNESATSL
jgi:hypothetical protein